MGGEESGGFPELLCGVVGAGLLGAAAGAGRAPVEE
jgi:hypothetical protein